MITVNVIIPKLDYKQPVPVIHPEHFFMTGALCFLTVAHVCEKLTGRALPVIQPAMVPDSWSPVRPVSAYT